MAAPNDKALPSATYALAMVGVDDLKDLAPPKWRELGFVPRADRSLMAWISVQGQVTTQTVARRLRTTPTKAMARLRDLIKRGVLEAYGAGSARCYGLPLWWRVVIHASTRQSLPWVRANGASRRRP